MGRLRSLSIPFLILIAVGLSACGSGGQAGAPPSSDDAIQSLATVTPVPQVVEAEEPAATALPQIGTASAGEIVYVREGQVWAIGADGANERPLTQMETGDVIRYVSPSPDGKWLAFTVNAQQLLAIDFVNGSLETVDVVQGGALGAVVWAADSSAVYYEKITLDVETSTTTSQLWTASITPGAIDARQMSVPTDLNGTIGISPLFGLDGGRLFVLTISGSEDADTNWLFEPATNLLAPLADGYSLLAVSSSQSQVLLIDQSEVSFGQQATPVNLYLGDLGEAAVTNIVNITASNEEGVYFAGELVPGGSNVVGMYYIPGEGESVASLRTEVIYLVAQEDGSYEGVPLASGEGYTALDARYHSEQFGVVVQRLAIEENSSEIWIAPLDGSAGTRLTIGEQPAVIPGQ